MDRDRVLYSPHFARLAEVTQVRTFEGGNLVHNRLTHSLKVGQLSRRIAEKLAGQQEPLAKSLGVEPEVAAAAGLAHDLGHPPFGHIAEDELNDLVGDTDGGYEGNAQTFRILTRLTTGDTAKQDGAELIPGLNLTRATLNAVLKYPWLEGENPKKKNKWGAYKSERDVFEWARLSLAPFTRPAEAEIMDWADDVTYAIHDLTDFYCAGLIPLHLLANAEDAGDIGKRELNRFFEGVFKRRPKLSENRQLYRNAFQDALKFFGIYEPFAGLQAQSRDLWFFSSELISRYVDAIELTDPATNGKAVKIDERAEAQTTILKELTWHYVILNNDLATIQFGQRKMIRDLFGVYLDAAEHEKFDLFPPGFGALMKGVKDVSPKRWTADFISGLTERELTRLHCRLVGPS